MYSLYLVSVFSVNEYYIKNNQERYLYLKAVTALDIKYALSIITAMSVPYHIGSNKMLLATFDSVEELLQNYPELFI